MTDAKRLITLTLNGEPAETAAPDLAGLLLERGLDPARVVAEINGIIVEKGRYAETALARGDVVELVRFVGGG